MKIKRRKMKYQGKVSTKIWQNNAKISKYNSFKSKLNVTKSDHSDKNYKESISLLNLSVPSIIVLKYMCILDKTQWWEKLAVHTTFSEINSSSGQNKVRLFEILINHLSLCTHIIYCCICIIYYF